MPTSEVDEAVEALPLEHQFDYWNGRVVRAALELEEDARSLWMHLAGGGPAQRLVPDDLGRLIEDCITVVHAFDLGDVDATDALDALRAAKDAANERHRVVHDRLVAAEDYEPVAQMRYKRGATSPQMTPRTIANVQDVEQRLFRAHHRIAAVYWLTEGAASLSEDFRQDLFCILREQFELTRGDGRWHASVRRSQPIEPVASPVTPPSP